MKLCTRLGRLEERFPVSQRPELGPCVHWAGSTNLPVHRWFRYREGYSPLLFSHFKGSRCRFDPFCGSGTTLLSSSQDGIDSYGLDLNPVATFVATVKTRAYSASHRKSFAHWSELSLEEWKHCDPAPAPAYPLLAKLFQPEAMDTLLRLQTFVRSVSPQKVRDLLQLAWLSIIEDSSNAFKDGNGLKYRNKVRRPGRYITVADEEWMPRYFGESVSAFVLESWRRKCAEIMTDLHLDLLPSKTEPEVRTGSCFDPANLDFGRKADLAIFSPPYANRFDYFAAYKMELWMGGFVTERSDLAALRAKSMRSSMAAPRHAVDEWPVLSPFLEAMDEDASSVRMGVKNLLNGYFDDMRTLLRNLRGSVTRGGSVAIVVGNSAYAKSIVPTDLLISAVAVEEGYRVQSLSVARPLHVSSQQRNELRHLEAYMRESVIVLRR